MVVNISNVLDSVTVKTSGEFLILKQNQHLLMDILKDRLFQMDFHRESFQKF